MIGTGLLWVGWYGFNAGSADGIAGNAFATTTFAAAIAWGPGRCSNISGEKSQRARILLGCDCGFGRCDSGLRFYHQHFIRCPWLAKRRYFFAGLHEYQSIFRYDDALDVFGVPAVAGTLGMIFARVFAPTSVNHNLATYLVAWLASRSGEQIQGMVLTAVLAVATTTIIAFGLKGTIGLRSTKEMELEGLDQSEHGYIYDSNNI